MKRKTNLKDVIHAIVIVIFVLLMLNFIFMIINFIRVSKGKEPKFTFYPEKYTYSGLFYSAKKYSANRYLDKEKYIIKAFGELEDPFVELNEMFEYMTEEQQYKYSSDDYKAKQNEQKEDKFKPVPIQIPSPNNN